MEHHPWSCCTEAHLWLCKVLADPKTLHVPPTSIRTLSDADVFYLVDQLDDLTPYAAFMEGKNKALVKRLHYSLYRWLCHLYLVAERAV